MTETISASDVLTWSQSVDGYSGALVLSNSGALIDVSFFFLLFPRKISNVRHHYNIVRWKSQG